MFLCHFGVASSSVAALAHLSVLLFIVILFGDKGKNDSIFLLIKQTETFYP